MLRWRLPLWFRRIAAARIARLTWQRLGCRDLPRPDHALFATHPVINSRWPLDVTRERDSPSSPTSPSFAAPTVRFADGSEEPIDLIIYATGYNISFPFIVANTSTTQGDRPRLCFNVFHPERNDLFVGRADPNRQRPVRARRLPGPTDCRLRLRPRPPPAARRCASAISNAAHFSAGQRIRYIDSPRHLVEVEHYQLSADAGKMDSSPRIDSLDNRVARLTPRSTTTKMPSTSGSSAERIFVRRLLMALRTSGLVINRRDRKRQLTHNQIARNVLSTTIIGLRCC